MWSSAVTFRASRRRTASSSRSGLIKERAPLHPTGPTACWAILGNGRTVSARPSVRQVRFQSGGPHWDACPLSARRWYGRCGCNQRGVEYPARIVYTYGVDALQEAIALAGSQAGLAYMLGVVPMAGTSRKRRGVPAALAFTHWLAETLRGLFSIGIGGTVPLF